MTTTLIRFGRGRLIIGADTTADGVNLVQLLGKSYYPKPEATVRPFEPVTVTASIEMKIIHPKGATLFDWLFPGLRTLRTQMKHKGRPGWRQIRAGGLPKIHRRR